jgi:hypothetical protein
MQATLADYSRSSPRFSTDDLPEMRLVDTVVSSLKCLLWGVCRRVGFYLGDWNFLVMKAST